MEGGGIQDQGESSGKQVIEMNNIQSQIRDGPVEGPVEYRKALENKIQSGIGTLGGSSQNQYDEQEGQIMANNEIIHP